MMISDQELKVILQERDDRWTVALKCVGLFDSRRVLNIVQGEMTTQELCDKGFQIQEKTLEMYKNVHDIAEQSLALRRKM